ncbi:hypothetical protein GH811_18120 [Acetobacterium malicum]|jgi:hypothetical protein|uniref:Uncharacterized protein n=1 Tax=Acetobacterium malicum TaxID=52692 RepID=A0ABR6Z1X2_9FIRM|nr:hypothetical protein [Acetobacterium malicum]MBC3901518.1 hypothetical protein [Acetobacterium malicum]
MEILINIASLCFWFALATSGIAAALIGLFFLSAVVCGVAGGVVNGIVKKRK